MLSFPCLNGKGGSSPPCPPASAAYVQAYNRPIHLCVVGVVSPSDWLYCSDRIYVVTGYWFITLRVIVAWKKLYTLSSLLKAVSIVSKDVNLENAGESPYLDLLAAVLSSHISCSLVYHFEGSAVNAPSSQVYNYH